MFLRGPNQASPPFPHRSFIAASALTLVLLLLTSWLTWRTYLEYESVLVRDIRLQELADVIEGGPAVSAQARSIAVTGRPGDSRSYHGGSAKIGTAIEEFASMTDDAVLSHHISLLASAHDEIQAIETRAFDLVHAGQIESAEELLFGHDYQTYLLAFERYSSNLEATLSTLIENDIRHLKDKSLIAFGVVTGCVPLLLVIWISILRTAKSHLDERNRMVEELRDLSLHDELTGLYNRRGFSELAEQQWRLARRTGRTMLLVFCDLDELKIVNDTHGHAFGDQALVETGKILAETFRESDIIGRVGGDEFVILITDFVDSDVRTVQRRIGRGLRVFNGTGNLPFALSLSIGYSWYDPREPRTIEELIAEADRTMYEQKKSRPNARIFKVV